MGTMIFQDVFEITPLSKLKEEDGSDSGEFPFYSSKQQGTSYYFRPQHLRPGLIIGTGKAFYVRFEDRPFATAKDCLVAYCKKEMKNKVNLKYVYYFFLAYSDLLHRKLNDKSGKKMRELLEEIEIEVVPLSVQNQIVAVMEVLSGIVEKRKRVLEKLLEYQRSLFLDMFGDPVINPKGYGLERISEVIPQIERGKSLVCEDRPRESAEEFAILKQGAITKRFFDADQNKYLDAKDIDPKWIVKKGDVLFSRKNDLKHVGATVYVFEECRNLLFPDTIYRLGFDPQRLSGVYLSFLMNDYNFHRKLTRYTTGTMVSMSNISVENLNVLEIPVPPIGDQKNFELQILQNQDYIGQTRRQLSLMLSLLYSAFRFFLQNGVSAGCDFKLGVILKNVSLEEQFVDCSLFDDCLLLDLFVRKVADADEKAYDKDFYDRMKHVLFGLLKAKVLKQKFDSQQKKMIVYHEVNSIKDR